MANPGLSQALEALRSVSSAYNDFMQAAAACRHAYGRRGGEWGVSDESIRRNIAAVICAMADDINREAEGAYADVASRREQE